MNCLQSKEERYDYMKNHFPLLINSLYYVYPKEIKDVNEIYRPVVKYNDRYYEFMFVTESFREALLYPIILWYYGWKDDVSLDDILNWIDDTLE